MAVDSLSLSVPKGEVFGLLGPNGSGKTTTLGMLLGLLAPTSGSVRLFGHDVQRGREHLLLRVGAIVEAPGFFPYLSGRDNLLYFQGITGRSDPGEVRRLLELVGLGPRATSKFSTYSTGMKQRLGVAYALLGDPELVVLDEPTNGLDPAGIAEMRVLIRDLGAKGRTVILSSHLLHEVEQTCDHVAILSKGRLITQGRVNDLVAGHGEVLLRTTDNAKAKAVLETLEWVTAVTERDGDLLATAPPGRSWEITAALAQAGVYVGEMSATRPSLEQYFLEITGDGPPPAQGPKP